MRLDERKLEELRRWGQALRATGSGESAAAGRAILLLIEELERLRLELWRVRERLEREDEILDSDVDSVADALHEEAVETAAARSWIETLRRQK